MGQQAVNTTRMLVAAFDWSTRRVERFHQLVAGHVAECRNQGADAAKTYELVRTLGREVGETVNGAILMADAARQARAAAAQSRNLT